jgi:hypothetical protein
MSAGAHLRAYRQLKTAKALVSQHRLPAMYPFREFVVDGGLLAYVTICQR